MLSSRNMIIKIRGKGLKFDKKGEKRVKSIYKVYMCIYMSAKKMKIF